MICGLQNQDNGSFLIYFLYQLEFKTETKGKPVTIITSE